MHPDIQASIDRILKHARTLNELAMYDEPVQIMRELTKLKTLLARYVPEPDDNRSMPTHTAQLLATASADQIAESVRRSIRDWRRQPRSLRNLAKLVGISASQLSRIGAGKQQPTLKVAVAILELQNPAGIGTPLKDSSL